MTWFNSLPPWEQSTVALIAAFALCGAIVYGAFLMWSSRIEPETFRLAREAVRDSGIHPAGRGRITDPADAAPVADSAVAAAAKALEVDPTDLRMGLRFDEADVLHLMGAVKAETWQRWADTATPKAKALAGRIYNQHLRSLKRGRR